MTTRSHYHTRRGKRADSGSHWISFSDILSSLLLVFVLAVCFTIYQYYSLLEIKTRELDAQKSELDRTQITLTQREADLETTRVKLMGKEEEIATIQIQLSAEQEKLHAAETALKTRQDEQAQLQLKLATQEETLEDQRIKLLALQDVLSSQQTKIDELLGVRTELIRALSHALNQANLNAKVDAKTGDIVLDSQLMFDSGQSILSAVGESQLSQLIPVYLDVLMRPEYKDYVAEIIIEGHTDSKGSYEYNLQLSQNRALAVATQCLNMPNLSAAQKQLLQDILTAKGRSYSNLIRNPDGSENMQASRRVEIKFRLKDTEMIEKMNEILSTKK